jgi:hypothetical protein
LGRHSDAHAVLAVVGGHVGCCRRGRAAGNGCRVDVAVVAVVGVVDVAVLAVVVLIVLSVVDIVVLVMIAGDACGVGNRRCGSLGGGRCCCAWSGRLVVLVVVWM